MRVQRLAPGSEADGLRPMTTFCADRESNGYKIKNNIQLLEKYNSYNYNDSIRLILHIFNLVQWCNDSYASQDIGWRFHADNVESHGAIRFTCLKTREERIYLVDRLTRK